MRKAKQDRLEKKGWKVGSVDEFLDLSPEESAYIEVKLRLSDNLRKRRTRKKLSQKQLATLIKSSQSRVAKMEGGDPTVSLDLLVKTLLVLGASDQDLANVIAARTHSPSG
jgi:predicted XRE-type DNA-binding protein